MSFSSQAALMSQEEIVALLQRNARIELENRELERRVAWLERYVFGQRSERRFSEIVDPRQLSLGESVEAIEVPSPPRRFIHTNDELISIEKRKISTLVDYVLARGSC